MKPRLELHIKSLLVPAVAFVALLALSGCVAYPGYGYGGGYYGAPAATVVVPVAPVYGWGGGWGHRGGWGGGGWGHGGHWR